jgi:hypothetical protein
MRLLYGPFEPDKSPFMHEGLVVASNVYPATAGYRPVGQFAIQSSALTATPLGAGTFVSPTGATAIIAGTATKLYHFSAPMSWTQIATGFTMGAAGRWRFAQFGGVAIATNGVDNMQKIDLSTFSVAPLGGSPPKLNMLTVVKDFLVGGIVDGVVNMVEWSGLNNAEQWTVGLNQCDYQIIPSGGAVTGLIGGEFGLILQRGRVSRMTYVGDNLVFQFDEISNNIGCVSPHSVIQAGQLGFWLADNGFMMWDGATIKPIGQERVDRTFAGSYTNADWDAMSTAVDLRNSLVAWAMKDRIFVYNWILDRWSIIDQAVSIVFSGFSRTLTLEEVGGLYPNLDAMVLSLDSETFKGGNPLFYAFDSSFRLGTFGGAPMAATLQTGDIEVQPGRDARVSMLRPIGDATNLTMTITSKARLGDSGISNSYALLESSGDMPVRDSGRTMRFTQTTAAGAPWSYVQGVDIVAVKGAKR